MNNEQFSSKNLSPIDSFWLCRLGAWEQPSGGCGMHIFARCSRCGRESCEPCYNKNKENNGGMCPGNCFGKFVLEE